MRDRWVSALALAATRRREADITARRLGHELKPWITVVAGGELEQVSNCEHCGDGATVRGRTMRAPLAGPAVTLRCTHARRDPPPAPVVPSSRMNRARFAAGLPQIAGGAVAPGPPSARGKP